MAYVTQKDLQTALSPSVYLAIFDDDGLGNVPDPSDSVAQVILRAHAEVASYLPRIYNAMPNELPNGIADLLVAAELDFACALSFERHPEYVKSYGEQKRAERWNRATARMERIADGIQQIPPNDPNQPPVPADGVLQGGIIRDGSHRHIIDSADGSDNSGDFG